MQIKKLFIFAGEFMRSVRHFWVSLIVAGLVLPGVLFSSVQAEDLVDFTLTDFITKQQVSTTSYRGKCMLIVFGSIYCKPCIEMLPVLRRLHEQYAALGLAVAAVDIDVSSEEEKISQFIKYHQIRHLYLVDTIRVCKQNKVFTLPTTLIVNASGGVEKRLLGFQDYEKLEKIVKKVLADIKS
jgi:thiol-disulfide isomerase/thioredoxin